MVKKKAVVLHSGGMDSSICLAVAIKNHGAENVLSLSFSYSQRHSKELAQAKKISVDFGVDHLVLSIDCLKEITKSALIGDELEIKKEAGKPPNTIVVGRNGLMIRIAAIHAHYLGAKEVYAGVIEVEGSQSGYPDCSRKYIDLLQQILRIDLQEPSFEIKTPVVFLSKKETLELALELGILDYLLENSLTCYLGIPKAGCKTCPACLLRNKGIMEFLISHPEYHCPYPIQN